MAPGLSVNRINIRKGYLKNKPGKTREQRLAAYKTFKSSDAALKLVQDAIERSQKLREKK